MRKVKTFEGKRRTYDTEKSTEVAKRTIGEFDGHCRPCRPLGAGRLPEAFVPEVKRLGGGRVHNRTASS